MIRYIFLDVAGTLLHKPSLFDNINRSLQQFQHVISLSELKYKHKLLSEIIHFPDRTDEEFYRTFNSELCRLLGILPSDELLQLIFKNCTYLPWEKFEDTQVLKEINIPMGIISNFNTSLKEKLNYFFGPIFKDILVSEEVGIAKPQIGFYEKSLQIAGLKPDEVLYIGDSMKLDVEPATHLGIKCLLIDRINFYESSPFKITKLNEILKYI